MNGLIRILIQTLMLMLGSCLESVGQDPVQGVLGKDVTLPCTYRDPVPRNVFWRIQGELAVLDIINSKPSTSSSLEKYKDRVSSFPEEYQKGNFSIVLKKLQWDDEGTYECHISNNDNPKLVQLKVSEPTPAPEERKEATPPSGGAAGPNVLHLAVSALSLLLCL